MKKFYKLLSVVLALTIVLLTASVVVSGSDDTVYFMQFSESLRNYNYGESPDRIDYAANGSATLISNHFKMQHVAAFKPNIQMMQNAIDKANDPVNGSNMITFAVSIIKIQNFKLQNSGAQIKVAINAKNNNSIISELGWVSIDSSRVVKLDVSHLSDANDITGVVLYVQDYTMQGSSQDGRVGCGNLEVAFSPFSVYTGKIPDVPTFPEISTDNNATNIPLVNFTAGNRNDYGNAPDRVEWQENGAILMKNINLTVQQQANFRFDGDTVKTAIAYANPKDGTGTGTAQCSVYVQSALDRYEKQGMVEIAIQIVTAEDDLGVKPVVKEVRAWQAPGTNVTYFIDISSITNYKQLSNITIRAQNYWYYNEKGQIVEKYAEGYKRSEVAPIVRFSNITVSKQKFYDGINSYDAALAKFNGTDVMLGDVNSDKKVNATDVLTLRKYLVNVVKNIKIEAADVTKDKNVNAQDVLKLRKYLANIIKSLE